MQICYSRWRMASRDSIWSNDVMKEIAQDVEFGFWEKYDETHSVIRFATSWATTMEDTQKLIQILEKNK